MFLEHRGESPKVHDGAYVAPNATLCGDVTVGENVRVMFGAVLTAEGGSVDVGANCVVMENAVVRGTKRHPTSIGDNVVVGPRAHLVGCQVGDNAFLATGATVFNGAVIGEGAEVRVNGTVHLKTALPPETVVPIGWVAVGDPAEVLTARRARADLGTAEAPGLSRHCLRRGARTGRRDDARDAAPLHRRPWRAPGGHRAAGAVIGRARRDAPVEQAASIEGYSPIEPAARSVRRDMAELVAG